MAPDKPAREEIELDDLYRDIILDHHRNPRNRGTLPAATVTQEGYNPLCGDEVQLDLVVADGRIKDVRYRGNGCSISQSSASMMTEAITGKTVEEAEELFGRFQQMLVRPESGGPQRNNWATWRRCMVCGGFRCGSSAPHLPGIPSRKPLRHIGSKPRAAHGCQPVPL